MFYFFNYIKLFNWLLNFLNYNIMTLHQLKNFDLETFCFQEENSIINTTTEMVFGSSSFEEEEIDEEFEAFMASEHESYLHACFVQAVNDAILDSIDW